MTGEILPDDPLACRCQTDRKIPAVLFVADPLHEAALFQIVNNHSDIAGALQDLPGNIPLAHRPQVIVLDEAAIVSPDDGSGPPTLKGAEVAEARFVAVATSW